MKRIRDQVVKDVAKFASVSTSEILSKGRNTQEVAEARQLSMYVFSRRANVTLAATSEAFNRHPSTVTFAVQKIKRKMGRGTNTFAKTVNRLCRG